MEWLMWQQIKLNVNGWNTSPSWCCHSIATTFVWWFCSLLRRNRYLSSIYTIPVRVDLIFVPRSRNTKNEIRIRNLILHVRSVVAENQRSIPVFQKSFGSINNVCTWPWHQLVRTQHTWTLINTTFSNVITTKCKIPLIRFDKGLKFHWA